MPLGLPPHRWAADSQTNVAFGAKWGFRLVTNQQEIKKLMQGGLSGKVANFFLRGLKKPKTAQIFILEWSQERSSLRTEAGIKITSCKHNAHCSWQFTPGLTKADKAHLLNYRNLR